MPHLLAAEQLHECAVVQVHSQARMFLRPAVERSTVSRTLVPVPAALFNSS
jgi:hypothetical protein